MTRTQKNAVLVAAALVLLVWAVGFAMAHSWYDAACCSERDCRRTVLREIERRADGWYVAITGEVVGFDDRRIKRSLDPLMHVCLMRDASNKGREKVRCLYVPEMPV